MMLAEQLVARTSDNSLTLFDKGFYSLGLLHAWQTTGCEHHWLLPLKKGTQYEVVHKLGRQDALVRLKNRPQARKKWPQLPETIEASLLTRNINGKERQVLPERREWSYPRCVNAKPQKYSMKKPIKTMPVRLN